jgi:hypothetical protein
MQPQSRSAMYIYPSGEDCPIYIYKFFLREIYIYIRQGLLWAPLANDLAEFNVSQGVKTSSDKQTPNGMPLVQPVQPTSPPPTLRDFILVAAGDGIPGPGATWAAQIRGRSRDHYFLPRTGAPLSVFAFCWGAVRHLVPALAHYAWHPLGLSYGWE